MEPWERAREETNSSGNEEMSQKTWDEGEKNFISHPLRRERESQREPERARDYILYQKTSGCTKVET